MGLREIAHQDLQSIFADASGFVWPCVITSPDSVSVDFDCRSNDIHLSIDTGTGDTVTGRQATVVVLVSDLIDSNFQTISGVANSSIKPWVVVFDSINGISGTYKVAETYPDHALGLMVMLLEDYTP
jgi:tetrahydromethanopterin S-methyltransferase subunit B